MARTTTRVVDHLRALQFVRAGNRRAPVARHSGAERRDGDGGGESGKDSEGGGEEGEDGDGDADGDASGGGDDDPPPVLTLYTTDEHPFWVVGRGWVAAGEIVVGLRVALADGSEAELVFSQRFAGRFTVFNFEVEPAHTYFVGADGVWVHNRHCSGEKGPPPNDGSAGAHGGTRHNDSIDERIQIERKSGAENIRKNQAQVDVNGNKVGDNKPDLQFDKEGLHHNVEWDNRSGRSAQHKDRIEANDPNAENEFNILDKPNDR